MISAPVGLVHGGISMRRYALPLALALVLGASVTAWAQQGIKMSPVLQSSTTMTGQPLQYSRTDRPEVTVAVLEIAPGGEVGRHMHVNSGFVYVLEGPVVVEMENGAPHEIQSGQAFVEATNTWHNAKNAGSAPVKLLIVWPGEAGKPNIVRPQASGADGTPPGASGAQPSASPK